MPEKQKKTIRELTLMLMYLTSWEERDTPEMRAVKKKELEKYPLAVSYTHLTLPTKRIV